MRTAEHYIPSPTLLPRLLLGVQLQALGTTGPVGTYTYRFTGMLDDKNTTGIDYE